MAHTPESLAARVVRSGVDWSNAGLRLADWLASRFTYRSREDWVERIGAGELTINGKAASPEQILVLHDVVEYHPQELPEPPADLRYEILFEDDDLLVIEKPGNLCMHPSGPFFKHTLWHLLASRFGEIHFLNRLDRETSGVLLAAKNKAAARSLSRKGMMAGKSYFVIVHGDFPRGTAVADGFLFPAGGVIRKKRQFAREMPQSPPFEHAETTFTFCQGNGVFSLLRAELGTGRMHQIRATLLSLGYPVVGDKLYGADERFYLKQRSDELSEEDRKRLILPRQALHSAELSFTHPETNERLSFVSPLPADMRSFVETFRTKGKEK